MPSTIIEVQEAPSVYAEGIFGFIGEVTTDTDKIWDFHGQFSFDGEVEFGTELDWEAEGEFEFTGLGNYAIDGAPDLEFTAEGEFGFEGDVNLTKILNPFFKGEFGFTAQALYSVQAPEEYELSIIVEVLEPPEVLEANHIHYRPRLKVGSAEIDVISGTYTEGDAFVGGALEVRLAKISDIDIITASSTLTLIVFGFCRRVNGVWQEETFDLVSDELVFENTSESIGWSNGPSDQVTVKFVEKYVRKLQRSPKKDLIIYNPSVENLIQDPKNKTYGIDGLEYNTELIPLNPLRLHGALGVLSNRMGLTFATNLPDYPINKVVVQIGQKYYDAISPAIGMFEPVAFERDNGIILLDGTQMAAAGMPAPPEVEISNYRTLSVDKGRPSMEAFLFSLIHHVEDLINYTEKTDDPVLEESGSLVDGSYSVTVITRTWREGRKATQPFVVVSRVAAKEVRETYDAWNNLINYSVETYEYDNRGKKTGRVKTVDALVPQLSEWNGSGSPSYALQRVFLEAELFEWWPDKFNPGSDYVRRRTFIQRGLILVDSEDLQMGVPFRQAFITGIRSGNIRPGVSLEWGRLKLRVEAAEQAPDGILNINIMEKDYIQNLVHYDRQQDRVGDASTKTFTTSSNRIIIFDGVNEFNEWDKVTNLSFGPLPIDQILPLTKRLLKRSGTIPVDVVFEHIGYNRILRLGTTVNPKLREEEPLGQVMLKGRTIQFDRESIMMRLTGMRI